MLKLIAPLFGEIPQPYKKVACIGEFEGKCPGPHDAFYTCGYFKSDDEIAANLCKPDSSTANRLKTVKGNSCGYGLIEATCSPTVGYDAPAPSAVSVTSPRVATAATVGNVPISGGEQITEQETKRRQEVLDRLWPEFSATEGACRHVGDPWLWERWVNQRLPLIGEQWQLAVGVVKHESVDNNYVYGTCNQIDVHARDAQVNNNHLLGDSNQIHVDAGNSGTAVTNGNEMGSMPTIPHK
jgi:hypothetical protein